VIAQSVNKRHIAFFNLHRLNTLDAVGVVLYKRIFFHLSNLYHPQKGKERLSFEKDYEDICAEWLGGLKPEKYRSKILQNQLGRHLDALKKTQLIRKYDVCRKADGSGFKIVFHPGDGFFDDYEEYYLRLQQPRLRFKEAHSVRLIQKPLELVAYFHEKVGHSGNTFSEKDTAQASKLLETYSESDVRDLIDFALDHARSTKFQMQHFGAVLTYLDRWAALLAARVAQSKRRQEIEACVICDESGYIQVKDRSGAFRAAPCPHNAAKLTEFEERTGLRRV
jgi:hypothetical protein